MTAQTATRWRNTTGIVAICLAGTLFFGAFLYRATYHVFPGMVPTVVHWCGRDYETGGTSWNWAQVTAAEAPRRVRVVGSYPPIFGLGHPLLAAPVAGTLVPGEPCAMVVYMQTGPGRYQGFSLEGGP